MVLFGEVVQILVASVENLPTEDPPDRLAVGRVMVRRHAQRLGTDDLDQPAQETARRVLVLVFAEQRVEEFTVPVDGTVEVAPAPGGICQISGR